MPAVNLAEHFLVRAGDHVRLRLVGDLLAEDVDRRELALLVQRADGCRSIGQVVARDVAGRDPAHDRTWHRRQEADDRVIE